MSSTDQVTKAVLTTDGRMLIERSDGSFRLAEGRTDWARVDAMTDAELKAIIAADPDDPGNDPDFWRGAQVVYSRPKRRVEEVMYPYLAVAVTVVAGLFLIGASILSLVEDDFGYLAAVWAALAAPLGALVGYFLPEMRREGLRRGRPERADRSLPG